MIFDILFIVALALGFWWGYKKGIIYSLFSMLGYFLGVVIALKFSYVLISFLKGSLNTSPKVLAVIAFVLVFIFIVLMARLVAWVLEEILKSFSLNIVNQIIGGVLHSLIALFVLCVLIWFANKMGVFPQKQKDTSHVYSYIGNLGPQVVDMAGKALPFVKDSFDKFEKLF
ncbi:MAG: CvpA family protein [Chitinophagales bacterium]